MAKMNEQQRVQVSLEVAQDAEEFIRKLVREEIKKILDEERANRGWQTVKPWPPIEKKGLKH